MKSPSILRANARMNRAMATLGGGLFLFGALLPSDWRSHVGSLGFPIYWSEATFPAIHKIASVSAVPELATAFFGIGWWATVVFVLTVASRDPMGQRVAYALSTSRSSPLKTLALLYGISLPVLAIIIWIAYALPMDVTPAGNSNWGYHLFMQMISTRFGLAVLGSIAMVGIGVMHFAVLVFFVGPVMLVLGRGSS